MRTLGAYLTRRGIKDFPAWRKSQALSSLEDVLAWCATREITVEWDEVYAKHMLGITSKPESISAPKEKSPKKESSVPGAPAGGEDKVWHVPAAERPITKPKPRTSNKKRTRSKKAGK